MFNEVKNVLEWCQTKNRLSIKRQKLQKKKKNQVEFLKMKSTIMKIKNSPKGLNYSFEVVK